MNKWISCKKKFPKDEEECLVAFYILPPDSGCGHAYSLATFIKGEFLSWELHKQISWVTHWMPLPDSPEADL